MKVLYKLSNNSKAQNYNYVNKNALNTTTNCKSFHNSVVKIDNIFPRTSFKSKLCIKIISSIRQFDLKYITCQYLYKLYEEKYSDYQILNACKELVELEILKSNLKQVGKFKQKYEFTVKLNNIDIGYFFCPSSIINDNRLTSEALQITLYLMTHNNNFIVTLNNIKTLLGIKSDRHANKHLNLVIELGYAERFFFRYPNGKREIRIRAKSIIDFSKDVDNSVEKEISTNEKKVTVTFSKTNIETKSSIKNKKEKSFKKIENKSISISQLTTNVVEDAQLEVIQQEVFNPLVELESDKIREATIVNSVMLNEALWIKSKYTLANLCNPFSKVGALDNDVATVIRKLSGRKFSTPDLHKLICDMQVKYLGRHEKLLTYNNLNDLMVTVIELIKQEKRNENDLRFKTDWMPQNLNNAIRQSQFEFTGYQMIV